MDCDSYFVWKNGKTINNFNAVKLFMFDPMRVQLAEAPNLKKAHKLLTRPSCIEAKRGVGYRWFMPGDSSRDLFMNVGGHQQPLKWSLNHPKKKVTKELIDDRASPV